MPRKSVLFCVVALLFLVGTQVDATANPPSAGSTISVNGQNTFALGANFPWYNYGSDFGANAWGNNGIAQNAGAVTSTFQKVHNYGGHVLRSWIFADARAGIQIDSSGTPTGIDPNFWSDMDALIGAASASNTYIIASLFDFMLLNWYSINNGVQMGGYNSWITDPNKLNALINNVVNPVLSHYGNEPRILAWEIMNEPEWIIYDLPQPTVDTSKVNAVSLSQFYSFASAISSSVHSLTNQYVTLGSACLKWYKIWTNGYANSQGLPALNLDFYQTHYYNWMDGQCINDGTLGNVCFSPIKQSYGALGLDRPMIVGEFYHGGYGAGYELDSFYNNGYAGALPWVGTNYPVDWSGYQAWANGHSGILPDQATVANPTNANNNNNNNNNNGGSGGLSGGAIAGITIGAIAGFLIVLMVVVAVVAVAVFFVIQRRHRASKSQAASGDVIMTKTPYAKLDEEEL